MTVTTFAMPSSPEDRKKIMDAVQEISNSMARIEGERSYIKETVDDLNDKFKIPKKLLSRFAKTYHKNSYADEQAANSDFETLAETLLPKNE